MGHRPELARESYGPKSGDFGDLEALLEHYLEHEDERRAIAEAARAKVPQYSFENLWQQLVDGLIEQEWDGKRHTTSFELGVARATRTISSRRLRYAQSSASSHRPNRRC